MDITLRQIKYFIAAAETGKIAAAASQLSISPSAITEAIKGLEKITGVSLITRHRKGINVTLDGYRFLQRCYNINAVPTMDIGLAWTKGGKLSRCARSFIEFCLMEFTSGNPRANIAKTKKSVDD